MLGRNILALVESRGASGRRVFYLRELVHIVACGALKLARLGVVEQRSVA